MGCVYLAKLICQFCRGWLDVRGDKSKKCRSCGYTVAPGELPNVLTMRELLSSNKLEDQLPEIQKNLTDFLVVMNKFRAIYGKAMEVTSGLRTLDHHIEIYKALAKQRKVPFDQSKVPMGSNHLRGHAVDIRDTDGSLYKFCQDNVKVLEDLGLYCEVKDDQPRVHFQNVKPGSGNRFFHP